MRSLFTLTKTDFKLYLREPAAFFFTLIFPVMLLLIFGAIFGNDIDPDFGPYGAMDVAVPGYTGLIIGTTTLLSIPIFVSTSRQQGIFRRMRATPLRPINIILSQSSVNLIMVVLGLILLVIGGSVFFGVDMPRNWLYLAASIVISYLGFAAQGFLIGGIAGSSRTAQVIGNVLYFPQLFLSGAAVPREIFSDRLRDWTSWLPMTQMIATLKSAWLDGEFDRVGALYMVALCVVCVAVATRFFKWESV